MPKKKTTTNNTDLVNKAFSGTGEPTPPTFSELERIFDEAGKLIKETPPPNHLYNNPVTNVDFGQVVRPGVNPWERPGEELIPLPNGGFTVKQTPVKENLRFFDASSPYSSICSNNMTDSRFREIEKHITCEEYHILTETNFTSPPAMILRYLLIIQRLLLTGMFGTIPKENNDNVEKASDNKRWYAYNPYNDCVVQLENMCDWKDMELFDMAVSAMKVNVDHFTYNNMCYVFAETARDVKNIVAQF